MTIEAKSDSAGITKFPVALHDSYFGVDELRIEDLLALIASWSGGVEFRDAANRPAGTWDRFAQSNELFLIGRLLAIDLNWQRERFRAQREALRADVEGSEGWWALVAELPTIRLSRTLDELLAQIRLLHSVAAVRAREKIENVITKSLAAEIHALRNWCGEVNEQRATVLFEQFGGIWILNDQDARQTPVNLLRDGFNAVFSAIQHLQQSLRSELTFSLQRRDHDPAVGLLAAFLQLRQMVQTRLNRFAGRELDLYYNEILKIAPRPIVPDRTILLLAADVGGTEAVVPAGTLFSGGLDINRKERLYASVSGLRVTNARISELHSFWFERSPRVSPENVLRQASRPGFPAEQYSTAARIQQFSVQPGNDPVTPDLECSALAPFGSRDANQGTRRGRSAALGIALASNVLAMKQGSREIRVIFEFESREGEPSIEEFVEKLSRLMETTRADAFFKTFRNAFRISVTEERGWFTFAEYLPTGPFVDAKSIPPNAIAISLRLPAEVGALVPFDPALHGAGYSTDLPVLRFELDEAYLYPYSLFVDLQLVKAHLEVRVEGCREVLAYNQLGRLSTASQFYPFGSTPTVGDYLIVGCEEVASKKLDTFELDINWASLPNAKLGFFEHYRGYSTEYLNQSFKVSLSALADRYWLPSKEKDRMEVELFDTKEVGVGRDAKDVKGPLSQRRCMSLTHLCKVLRPSESQPGSTFSYDISTRSGFVKLTLSAPSTGFGHREYPMALYDTAAKNGKKSRLPIFDRLRKERVLEPIPVAPYTPVIDYLTVNYSANDQIDFRYSNVSATGPSAYHIHPLGVEPLQAGRPEGVRLAPHYREDGHLFIGIAATELRGPLTLFFHLKEGSSPSSVYRESHFNWYFLSQDQWLPLSADQILSDGTYGFLKPGIVSLEVPSAISSNNTLCPPGLYWLRVSAEREDVANVCRLFSIHAHGVEVVWQPDSGSSGDHLGSGLAAGTIKESKTTLPGIGGIRQPVPSWGGKIAETRPEKILRVSRRLSHKQRAVTASDYEALVLQEFSDLHCVRCFSSCAGDPRAPLIVSPGELFLVVIPQLAAGNSPASGPMVDALELKEITRFVAELSSDAVKVRVSNPSYDLIQVRCKVHLKKGQNPGESVGAVTRRIEECLSPWSAQSKIPPFGWRLRCIDVQAFIQNLRAVTLATGVSLLQIGTSDGRKVLFDTARGNKQAAEPRLPWSVALPFSEHLIEIVDDSRAYMPSPAGYGNLVIGSTFIGTRGSDE